MSGVNKLLGHALDLDLHLERIPVRVLGIAKVYLGVDDGVLGFIRHPELIGNHLNRGEEARCRVTPNITRAPTYRRKKARTGVAHCEKHLRILAVSFASERLGHGETQREPVVVVGLDLAVASLASGGGVGGVLCETITTTSTRRSDTHSPCDSLAS